MTTRLQKSALNIIERSAFLRFSAALAAVLIAVMLRMALTPLWGPTALPFFFFYPAVVFCAWLGRLQTALFAIVLSALAADYLFFEPIMAIRFPDLIGLAGFIALSFFMAFAIHRLHRANDAMQRALEQSEQSERAVKESESLFQSLLNNSSQ